MKDCSKPLPESETLLGKVVDKMMVDNPITGSLAVKILAKVLAAVYEGNRMTIMLSPSGLDSCQLNIDTFHSLMILFIASHLEQAKMHELPLHPFLIQYLKETAYLT